MGVETIIAVLQYTNIPRCFCPYRLNAELHVLRVYSVGGSVFLRVQISPVGQRPPYTSPAAFVFIVRFVLFVWR